MTVIVRSEWRKANVSPAINAARSALAASMGTSPLAMTASGRQPAASLPGAVARKGVKGEGFFFGLRPNDQFGAIRISGLGTVQHAPSSSMNTTHIRWHSGP